MKDLGVAHVTLDSVYEKSRSFKTLNRNLAKAVQDLGEGVVYLVDGAASEDNSVKILCKRFKNGVRVINGVSKVSAILEKAGFADCSYTAVSAYELSDKLKEGVLAPLLVFDIDDCAFASEVKLLLADKFGDEYPVRYISGEQVKKIPLYELDRQKEYGYFTAVALEKCDLFEKNRFTFDDLVEIVVKLRAPNGCPWDRVQTNETIKMNAIEEAYELVDAVDSGDDDKLLEEAGDLLLQAVFHAVIKAEEGAFNATDTVSGICQKLISRHTHIFGKDKATDEESALGVWDKNKMNEKHQATFADSVNDVPKAFPAAMRAQKVGKRAAKAGMDFLDAEQALASVKAELKEFETAAKSGKKENAFLELGDVLFSVVNLARKSGIDAEQALKETTEKFASRFTLAEQKALQEGKTVTDLSAEEWDRYYRAAKAELLKKE